MCKEIRLLVLDSFFSTSSGDVKMRSLICGDVTIGALKKKKTCPTALGILVRA